MYEGISSSKASSLHEAALEGHPDPIIVHDYDTILYANPAALQALRASGRDDVIGMPAAHFTHEQSREAGAERRRLVLEHGVWLKEACVKLRACDGTVWKMTGEAGRIGDGEPMVMVIGRTMEPLLDE